MNLFDSIPIKLTFFLAIGIICSYHNNIPLSLSISAYLLGIFLLGIELLHYKIGRNSFFGLLFTLTAFFMGIHTANLALPKSQPLHYSHNFNKKAAEIGIRVIEILKKNKYNRRFIAEVFQFANKPANGKILLSLPLASQSENLEVDDLIFAIGNLEIIEGPKNPHQFNYKNYMKLQGVYHQIVLKHNYYLKKRKTSSIKGTINRLRDRLNKSLENYPFKKRELGIIKALLLGDRTQINPETFGVYKNAGAVHLLAVSGLHIGVVLLLLNMVLSPLKRIPKGKLMITIISILLLWFYALLCGLSPSVIRAVSMFSFVAYALYINRAVVSFNIVGLSMLFLLLLYDPFLLFQIGFQFSYAAVLSIFWVFPKINSLWKPSFVIFKKTWQLLALSIAAQLGVFPLSLFYFHEFPLLFFISNLLLVPFLGLILGMGFLILILAVLELLPNTLFHIYEGLIRAMNEIILSIGNLESFVIKNIYFDEVGLVLTYAIIILLSINPGKKRFKYVMVSGCLFICLQLWNSYSLRDHFGKEKLFILHIAGKSTLLHKDKKNLIIYCRDSVLNSNLVNRIKTAERSEVVRYRPLNNVYKVGGRRLLLIDNAKVPLTLKFKTDYLLLTNSPRINLNRYLDSIKPKWVIADGSNYNNLISLWRKSCLKKKIPFYSTAEKGAMVLLLDELSHPVHQAF
ncbi:MAG: ComEC/Rec2 family competence protein [Eudoraea sp.]